MNIHRDLTSKFVDGLIPAFILYLLNVLILMTIGPLDRFFGGTGLLVFVIGLVAVAMFSLQRALWSRSSEVARAWYGMAGGLLAWWVIEASSLLENRPLVGLASFVVLIMASLMTGLLWRPFLPLGARFFMASLLGLAGERVAIVFLHPFSGWSPVVRLLYIGLGIGLIVALIGVMAWMFLFSERRIQRMGAALSMALLAIGVFYLFLP